jgi:5'-nucleotidase
MLRAAAAVSRDIALALRDIEYPNDASPLLNVNFPAGPARGIRTTVPVRRLYEDRVVARLDPYGREYFWIGGRPVECECADGTDIHAVANGFISVTPLGLEAADAGHLETARAVAAACESLLARQPAGELEA